MDISVVIPLLNEDESLPELFSWINKVMTEHKYEFEVIFVDDGSTDKSWSIIQDLRSKFSQVHGIKFQRNYGKSAALNEGFALAKGSVVITMDADLQDSPDEIPKLYDMIVKEKFDLVSGWKKKRYDPISKTIPTKLFNWTNRRISGVQLHDMNCGLKAYSNKVVKSIEIFGEMHRYIPVLAKGAGFSNIGEMIVQHQARKYGVSKYMGWNRFVNGILDLFTVNFITKFGKKPMHFFGLIGFILFLIGFAIAGYLAFTWLIWHETLSNRPLFITALVIMLIGSQFFLAGFLGELITRNSAERNQYLIDEVI
jgi:glycosyltransferase involved in cell wall biosynthesis